MKLTDELQERLLGDLKSGDKKNLFKYFERLQKNKAANSMEEAVNMVADPDLPLSLMSYLIKKERYEDAQFVKGLCDVVRPQITSDANKSSQ